METAKQIMQRLSSIVKYQTMRQNLLERHFFMYGHSNLTAPADFFQIDASGIRLNLVQSCVDTLLNKITKDQPRPVFLTDGADWEYRKKAEKRTEFAFGMFHKTDTYTASKKALLNALIFGDGFVKTYSVGKEIYTEPVSTLEVIFDENEWLYGKGRSMYQVRLVDKQSALEMFPGKKELIEKAPTEVNPFYINSSAESELIMFVEYWRIGIKQNDGTYKGGMHRLMIGGEDVQAPQEWQRGSFPFAQIGFVGNVLGPYSKGVAETITSHQIEVNRTLKRISDSLRLCAVPRVLYEYGSKIVKAHFNNEVGQMLGYMGVPPQFVTAQAVSPELFPHLQWCVQSAYNEVGISMLSATAQKPEGLDSGKALREFSYIETERFAALVRSWNKLHVDISVNQLEEAKAIAKKHKGYSVMVPGPKQCKVVNFADVDMDNDKMHIQGFPSAMLPKEPAGRFAYIQEMLNAGLFTPDEGASLLEYPDVEKITRFKNSKTNDILFTIDHMLDTDEYLPPEPYQNLQLGVEYMTNAYLYYKREGCPQEKLNLLLQWTNDALDLLKVASAPAAINPEVVGDEVMPTPADQVPELPTDAAIPTEGVPV